MEPYFNALAGGVLIGLASVLMLISNGRMLGVSGILGGLLHTTSEKKSWRALFLLGLLSGGIVVLATLPGAYDLSISRTPWALVAAGLLVGYGTRLGGGCTSGHGICGISRLSPRSLVATLLFIGCGAMTVFFIGHFFGGRL